ncbi:MAG: molybdenum cofactor guanylyltransferase [Planctomycetaceae bacterium]
MVAVKDEECKQPNGPAAVVLTGGESRRMGREKHLLPFGNEVLLQRICRLLRPVASTIVVVAASGQEMPALPGDVAVVRDEFPGEGPLGGIITGMAALRDEVNIDSAWVCGCDNPFVNPGVVQFLHRELADFDAVVVRDGGRVLPLSAVYRRSVELTARRLFQDGERRASAIAGNVRTRSVEADSIRDFDPELLCLWNMNTSGEYEQALARARQ